MLLCCFGCPLPWRETGQSSQVSSGQNRTEQGEAIREETRITKNHDNKDKDKDNDKK